MVDSKLTEGFLIVVRLSADSSVVQELLAQLGAVIVHPVFQIEIVLNQII